MGITGRTFTALGLVAALGLCRGEDIPVTTPAPPVRDLRAIEMESLWGVTLPAANEVRTTTAEGSRRSTSNAHDDNWNMDEDDDDDDEGFGPTFNWDLNFTVNSHSRVRYLQETTEENTTTPAPTEEAQSVASTSSSSATTETTEEASMAGMGVEEDVRQEESAQALAGWGIGGLGFGDDRRDSERYVPQNAYFDRQDVSPYRGGGRFFQRGSYGDNRGYGQQVPKKEEDYPPRREEYGRFGFVPNFGDLDRFEADRFMKGGINGGNPLFGISLTDQQNGGGGGLLRGVNPLAGRMSQREGDDLDDPLASKNGGSGRLPSVSEQLNRIAALHLFPEEKIHGVLRECLSTGVAKSTLSSECVLDWLVTNLARLPPFITGASIAVLQGPSSHGRSEGIGNLGQRAGSLFPHAHLGAVVNSGQGEQPGAAHGPQRVALLPRNHQNPPPAESQSQQPRGGVLSHIRLGGSGNSQDVQQPPTSQTAPGLFNVLGHLNGGDTRQQQQPSDASKSSNNRVGLFSRLGGPHSAESRLSEGPSGQGYDDGRRRLVTCVHGCCDCINLDGNTATLESKDGSSEVVVLRIDGPASIAITKFVGVNCSSGARLAFKGSSGYPDTKLCGRRVPKVIEAIDDSTLIRWTPGHLTEDEADVHLEAFMWSFTAVRAANGVEAEE